MSGSLVLLPLRVGVRAVELVLHGAADVLERVAGLAGADVDRPPSPDAPADIVATPTPTPAPRPAPAAEVPLVDRGEAIDYDAVTPAPPAHLEIEDELVDAVSEPGAQDGAGASVRVAEPWEGYRELRAADVVDRLGSVTREELAAIELYELSRRQRRTVIAAAQRELRRR